MGCFSKASTKVKVTPSMDPYARQNVLDPLAKLFNREMFGQGGAFAGGTQDWSYPGQRVAGIAPAQQQAFNYAAGLPGQAQAYQNMGLGMLAQSPNFDATRAYTANLWNRDIAPSVMERFAGMGTADSGGAQQGLMRAGEQMSLGLASQLAPMELQARQGAANALPGMYGMGLSGLGAAAGLGAEQRGIGQEQLSSQMGRWYEQSPWNHPAFQWAGPMMGTGVQSQMYNKPQGMALDALSGPGQMLGQMLGGMTGKAFGGIGMGMG